MISVVICSANPQELAQVTDNIAATIGVPHEVIAFDNRKENKGICEIYNRGTRQARYDIICFMHEDIEMQTQGWGSKVAGILKDTRIGLVGIAGGGYKSLAPSSWYNYYLQENGGFYCSLIQGFKHTGKPDQLDVRNPRNESLACVACVDGCWFCTRKSVAEKYPFDASLLKGFHGYDLDFSIALSQQYAAVVTYDVLLKHFSEGNFNKSWLDEMMRIHKKWSHVLPLNVDQLPEQHLKRIERHAFEVFLQQCVDEEKYSKPELLSLIWSTRKSRVAPFSFPYKLAIRLLKMKKTI